MVYWILACAICRVAVCIWRTHISSSLSVPPAVVILCRVFLPVPYTHMPHPTHRIIHFNKRLNRFAQMDYLSMVAYKVALCSITGFGGVHLCVCSYIPYSSAVPRPFHHFEWAACFIYCKLLAKTIHFGQLANKLNI